MPHKNSMAKNTANQMLEYTGAIEPRYMRSTPGGRMPPRKKSVPTDGNGGYMALQFLTGVKPQYMAADPPKSKKKSHHHEHASHTPKRSSHYDPQDDHGRSRAHGGPSRHHREEPHREEVMEPSLEEQYRGDSERRHHEAWMQFQQSRWGRLGSQQSPLGNAQHGNHQDDLSGRPYPREPDNSQEGNVRTHIHPGFDRAGEPAAGQARFAYVNQESADPINCDDGSASGSGVVVGEEAYGHQHNMQQSYQQQEQQQPPPPPDVYMGHGGSASGSGVVLGPEAYGHQQQQPYQQPQQPPPPAHVHMGHDVHSSGFENPAPSTVGADYAGSEASQAAPLVAYDAQGVMYQVRPGESYGPPHQPPYQMQPQPRFCPEQQQQVCPEQQQQIYPEQPMLPLQQQHHGGAMVLYHADRKI